MVLVDVHLGGSLVDVQAGEEGMEGLQGEGLGAAPRAADAGGEGVWGSQGGEGQRCDYLSGVGGLVPRMSSQDLSSARPTGYLV